MNQFTPLFKTLFDQSPLPLKGVEMVALQLCYLKSKGAMFEAFKEAALAASPGAQAELKDWTANHWDQLSRNLTVSDYERERLDAVRRQIDDGSVTITGVCTDAGLVFTRSTEDS